jgi:hypothetical protein
MDNSSGTSVNKRDVKSITKENKKALCEEWQSLGITASEFCRERGLVRSTFHGWCKELNLPLKNKKRVLTKKSNTNWIPLTHTNDQSRELQGFKSIEIKISNQMIMKLSLSMDDIQLLLGGLCNATTIIR